MRLPYPSPLFTSLRARMPWHPVRHRASLPWIQQLVSPVMLGLILAVGLTACGGSGASGGTTPPPANKSAGLLAPLASESDLLQVVRQGMLRQASSYRGAYLPGAATMDGSANFSSTYTLETNVDEFDRVKYDGQHLFVQTGSPGEVVIADRTQAGAAVSALGLVPWPGAGDSAVRILATRVQGQPSASEVARIGFDKSLQIMGMYLNEQRLTTLAGTSYYGTFGPTWQDMSRWDGPHTRLNLHDVSQASAPKLMHEIDIEGGFVQSRRIGNTVYVVTRHTPHVVIQGTPVEPNGSTPTAEYASKVAQLGAADIIPKITINGASRPLFDAKSCYTQSPNDTAVFDPYPVISSITAVNLGDPAQTASVCYLGEAYGVYLSESALYLTQTRYQATPAGGVVSSDMRPDTRVHKFALAAATVRYAGSADVAGTVWGSAQSDFRMSEHQGYLRLLTTAYRNDPANRFEHRLYVLRESSTAQALEPVATLPNTAHPQPIGKPNEDLFGVRFFGDRAYAVTFERKDPLYVLDLSNPASPVISGSLELPGFSSFLHPVSRELLLGLGQDGRNRLKLELFYVADNAAPVSRGAVTLGGPGSYSEALYNRNAFTYLASVTGADRMAIPATLTSEPDGSFSQSGQYQFEIRNKGTPAQASLRQVGTVLTAQAGGPSLWWGGWGARSVIHDGATFFVDQAGVWPGLWGYDSRPSGPL